jgi:hypothetical protein
MEEKQLNEKESLELITQMIRNTQQRIERGNGIPFLIWGYTTVLVSLLVWFTLKSTQNYYWNLLWFLIPVIGFTAMTISMKKEKKGVTTYIDKVIMYVWIVIGIAAFIPAPAATIMEGFPILFIVTLLISIGTAITGLIIRFVPLIVAGFIGMFLSIFCLILGNALDSVLVFAALFLIVQVIPGHILNWKGRKHV